MGGFFPTESFGPRGEEMAEGVARTVFALDPRNFFDLYAAAWAIDSRCNRHSNLTAKQSEKLTEVLQYELKTTRAYFQMQRWP